MTHANSRCRSWRHTARRAPRRTGSRCIWPPMHTSQPGRGHAGYAGHAWPRERQQERHPPRDEVAKTVIPPRHHNPISRSLEPNSPIHYIARRHAPPPSATAGQISQLPTSPVARRTQG
ncbi:hypothetical protein L202_00332 [Cryptococcus amylolentus CBS 6039]|uniref:Uncharacterized protein n=1 Tax=Cryptococcus amylolentus CBS 6039 TaxID=1295533 RepID=A0A1E3I725_9TREE|nr:hypothetical protein L202_00332 [Cryptococcus amylolentus CBS 6039]ODN84367.1 hypothetical protein L202_00332 [Cryptococcus amylolentus CBS 6039]